MKNENLVAKYKNYYEVTANELTEINKQLKQVEAENAALRERLRPVEEVYRKYLPFMQVNSPNESFVKYEFWQAICKTMETY